MADFMRLQTFAKTLNGFLNLEYWQMLFMLFFNRSYFIFLDINYTVDNITFSLLVPKVNTIILINKLMEIKSSEYIF